MIGKIQAEINNQYKIFELMKTSLFLKQVSKKVLTSFKDLLYPPLCLHCEISIKNHYLHLCDECHSLLELIDPTERCPLCFSADYSAERLSCSHCHFQDPLFNHFAAAFDHMGPAATIVRKLKYANQPYLAKGIAAFMALQLLQMNWPLPDFIVPVPLSFSHWLDRGYNQTFLIAQSLSEILSRPVADIITRRSGDYSQAGLKRVDRLKLDSGSFKLKKNASVADKNILLIDDVMTTGRTLRCCGEVLLEACPQSIYAMAVCRAV
ncbi:MAG: ComF family protein [Parachlamydiaceae bacterium]|nr:ComF family protein [Parachlamydiaceae bacterium]